MRFDSYDHLVVVTETQRTLAIYRVNGNDRHLFTFMTLPDGDWKKEPQRFSGFCRQLGENILLDSPQGRRLLRL